MKTKLLKTLGLAAIAALFCLDCADSNVNGTGGGEVNDLLRRFNGADGTDVTTYTIRFDPNGGAGKVPDAIVVTKSNNSILLPSGNDLTNGDLVFVGWSTTPNGTATHPANTTYTITGNITLYAKWDSGSGGTITTYTLSVGRNIATGGSVSRNPSKSPYNAGDTVTVTATAAENYEFTGWTGSLESTTNPLKIVMDGNKDLTAYFEWRGGGVAPPDSVKHSERYTLVVSVPNGGGSVSLNPDEIDYEEGTQVTATATPLTGYKFKNWTGESTSTAASVTITMNGDKTLTAVFELIPPTMYTLTISATSGGTVSPTTGTHTYAEGTSVNVTASPNSDYTFTGWTGASSSTSASVTITMNRDKTLTANFKQQQVTPTDTTYTITFDPNSGSVSPTSGKTGTNGKLTSLPTPTRSGYTYRGWYTAATGGDSVALSKVYTADTRIYARWTQNTEPPPTGNTFTDSRDSKTYKKVTIGSQVWMGENLNYNASGSVCYENSTTNCEQYGRLYNWATANSACPSGWHLPSDAEWDVLMVAVGGVKDGDEWWGEAGKKLKSTSGWYDNGNGTGEYGFSALPGGRGDGDGSFIYIGSGGLWWSATQYGASDAWRRYMDCVFEGVVRFAEDKQGLLSVRCVEDQ